MHPNWPLIWPAEWHDAAALDLLKDTPPGFLLFDSTDGYQNVVERARQLGIAVCDIHHPPTGVEIVKGEWPGIRLTPGQADASSGPTGAPWIDSNGWLVRLTHALKPGSQVWVMADPPKSNVIMPLSRHLIAMADAAVHGGCWAVRLDKPETVSGWQKLAAAAGFFQAHREWNTWRADAALAVVSSFSGGDEFFSHELLNLMARTNVSYSIVAADRMRAGDLTTVRAVIYPDRATPSAELRQRLLDFAERGGLLIVGAPFGSTAGPTEPETNPRYGIRRFGKGRIATAHKPPEDPYEMAQDAQLLLSHRYDRVRLFNAFLLGSYCTMSPDGRRTLAHVINYAGGAGDDPVTARVAGRFRSAKVWPLEATDARRVEMVAQGDAVELHLPRFDVYAGVELEA